MSAYLMPMKLYEIPIETGLSIEIHQQLVPPAKNHRKLQHVIPHGSQYDQAE
jgi:hypothetical protein